MGGKVSLEFNKGDLVEIGTDWLDVWDRGIVVEELDEDGFIEVRRLDTHAVQSFRIIGASRLLGDPDIRPLTSS
jgi:hypothetical protein